MATITIPKNITGQEELVVIPRKEFERMRQAMVPVFYLKGKAARRLDARVTAGLREYRAGKTGKIRSLADFDS